MCVWGGGRVVEKYKAGSTHLYSALAELQLEHFIATCKFSVYFQSRHTEFLLGVRFDFSTFAFAKKRHVKKKTCMYVNQWFLERNMVIYTRVRRLQR